MANFLKWTSNAADPKSKKRKLITKSSEEKSSSVKLVKTSTVIGWKLDYLDITTTECGMFVEKLKCKYCCSYPELVKAFANPGDNNSNIYIEGTTVIKKCNAENHAKNKGHIKAREKYNAIHADITPVGQSIKDVVSSMNKNENEKIKKLFDISYYLAKEELPFTLFPAQIELEKRHGVDLGITYTNAKACKTFTMFIAETLKDDLLAILKEIRYVSFLTDGSTDRSQKEKELIYLKYLRNGKPLVTFASIMDLQSSTAEGVKNALKNMFEKELDYVEWKSHIVAGGADGASVNFGPKSGLMKIIRDEVPWLVSIHCVAHRLELAVKDSLETTSSWKEIEDMLLSIHSHFQKSPKRWRDFQSLAKVMEENVVKPGQVGGTRWISHKKNSLVALSKNYSALVTYFKDIAETDEDRSAPKIRGYLKKFCSYEFVLNMAFFLDVLDILSHFSLQLQKDNLHLSSLTDALIVANKSLKNLQTEDGEHYTAFKKEIKIKQGHKYYFENELTCLEAEKVILTKQHDLIGKLINCMEERFGDLTENEVLKCASIFDPANWNDSDKYGFDEVNYLVNHFKEVLQTNNCITENIQKQWQDLKYYVRKYHPTSSFLNLWEKIFTFRGEEYKDFLHLAEIILVLPFSTSIIERMFSVMKRVKSDWRTSLNEDTLCALLRINAEGPALTNFEADRAVKKWFAACDRRPGVN